MKKKKILLETKIFEKIVDCAAAAGLTVSLSTEREQVLNRLENTQNLNFLNSIYNLLNIYAEKITWGALSLT